MKKTLSMLAVLGVMCFGIQSANAFSWSSLNPAYWGHCPRCQKIKNDCGCKKKCNPCEGMTGAAANCDPCAKKKPCRQKCDPCRKQEVKPCDPCQKVQQPCDPCQKKAPCDPCDKLQNMNK